MSKAEKTRAFWALALLVPAPSLGIIMALWVLPGAIGQAIYAFFKLWLVGFPLVWWLKVDRKKVSWSPMRNGGLGFGALSGIGIAVSIFAAYWLFGDRLIDPEQMRQVAAKNELTSKANYLVLVLYLTFVNSLLEEYVWRWFVYRKSETLMVPGLAMVATAIFFSIHHALALYPQFGWGVTVLGSSGTFIGSLVWSWCYRRYGSVWPAYLSHIFADVAVFLIGWIVLFEPVASNG